MLDIALLRIFVAVSERNSITAGSRAEGISPSLASRRITALEQLLGCRLLLRTTRQVTLTAEGHAALSWARDTLRRREQLVDELGALAGELRGTVRIASSFFTGHHYLSQTIQSFRQAHPDVQIEATITDNPGRLISEGYDIAIHAGPMLEGNFVGRRIRTYPRIVCAAPSYLARKQVPETPADLVRLQCLMHATNERRVWYFCSPEGSLVARPLDAAVLANSYMILRDLALSGLGVIRVAESVVGRDIAEGRLMQILEGWRSVDATGQDFGIWLLYPSRQLPQRVQLFVDHLATRLGQPGPFTRPG